MDSSRHSYFYESKFRGASRPFGWRMLSSAFREKWRARRATSTLFLVDGMTFGTWAALIPSFQQKFSLSEAQLSLVLLGLVVGALISMPLTGRMITGWGSRAIAFPAALTFCGALTLLALAPNYSALIAAALLFGALKGAVDVSINAQAITMENAIGKPIMSGLKLSGVSAGWRSPSSSASR